MSLSQTELLQEASDMIVEHIKDRYRGAWNSQPEADRLRRCKMVIDGVARVQSVATAFELRCENQKRKRKEPTA